MQTLKGWVQACLGGLIAGSLVGLGEAVFLLVTQGAPDLLSPLYAVLLYGAIGACLGLPGGLFITLVARRRDLGERFEPASRAAGASFALGPMLLFIGLYLGNKILFAEQGIPLGGKLAMLVGALVVMAVELGFGIKAYGGWARRVLRVPVALGLWGLLVVVTGLVSLIPIGGDARARWAHGKPVPPALADRPNVLLIAIDTLRADRLGAYGMEGDPTPALDGIARDGIVFEDASAHASWTRSSFASLWSSRIPSAHKADLKASRLADELVLFPEVLQGAGVTTANLANNINVTRTFNFDQGFDTFIYEAPAYHFGATESVFSLTFYKVVHKLREKLGGAKDVHTFYQPAEVVFADAQGFIQANRASRWMLGVHLMEPHDPYFEHPYLMPGGGPDAFNGIGFARAEVERPSLDQVPYLERVYLDEIRHMDLKIAEFVRWLKAEGLYDDLLIVVTSDHGEEFGEHGGFWHGTTLYEEQIHVPLIVKLPKNALAGERVAWQARLIDVAPTVTAALGLPADPTWAGRDLIADVQRAATERDANAAALAAARLTVDGLSEARDAGRLPPEQLAMLTAAEGLLATLDAPTGPCDAYQRPLDRVVVAEEDFEGNVISAVKTAGFKLIRSNANNPRGLPEVELFDLRADPAESADLKSVPSPVCGMSPKERVEALTAILRLEVQGAASGAVQAEQVEVDAAETCRLCALGYLDGAQCEDC